MSRLWPCVKCGSTNRNKKGDCIPCHKEACRRYREANREKVKESWCQYYRNNSEKIKKSNLQWHHENRERQNENSRQWHRKNRERSQRNNLKWNRDNPGKVKETSRRWQMENPEKVRASSNRHRVLKTSAQSEPYNFKAICSHYNNRCVSCGRGDLPLAADHIVPLSKGGPDTADNIQPLCKPCNSSKGDHHQTDYRPDQGPPIPRQLKFWQKKLRSF